MTSGKDETPENANDPYDSVEIVKDVDGVYCARFYIAAERDPRMEPADDLETLVQQQKHFREQGCLCPLTDRAIYLLRQALNLPDLH